MKNIILLVLSVISLVALAIGTYSMLKLNDVRTNAYNIGQELLSNKNSMKSNYERVYTELRRADIDIQAKIDYYDNEIRSNGGDENEKSIKVKYEKLLQNVLESMITFEKAYRMLNDANDRLIDCNEKFMTFIDKTKSNE